MFPLRFLRAKFRVVIAILILILLLITAKHSTTGEKYKSLSASFNKYGNFSPFQSNDDTTSESSISKPTVGNFEIKPTHQFWEKVFTIFDDCKPDIPNEKINEAIQYVDKSQHKGGPNTKDALLSKAFISDDVFNELKSKHDKVLKELPASLPDSLYRAGTSGVVFVGGGKFSWLSYLSLLALRDAGSQLPVEIVMPTFRDYEREIELCKVLLPPLKAACVVVPDVLGPTVMLNWQKEFASYQFKSLALMTSSFQNILLLDSDNIILENPDSLFKSQLFKEYGMITWPDYWERTISPAFYDIAGMKVNELKRVRYNRFPLNVAETERSNLNGNDKDSVPFHDLDGTIPNLSTESGQFVINKATHGETLLLSLYYNLYGPKFFYKLFSLGEQGEGDKDTFVTAAVVSKQKFYQVKSFIQTFGYADANDKFQGVAMGQKDPINDYKMFQDLVVQPLHDDSNKLKPIHEQIEMLEKILKDRFDSHNDNPLFAVHCNYPKLDPLDLIAKDDIYDKENSRLKYKLYGGLHYKKYAEGENNNHFLEIDFELHQWKTIIKVLCEDKLYFVHFEDKNMDEICKFIDNQVKWLSAK